ncbi:hypothetical protein Tco_0863109 [Tanacetum coccineum]
MRELPFPWGSGRTSVVIMICSSNPSCYPFVLGGSVPEALVIILFVMIQSCGCPRWLCQLGKIAAVQLEWLQFLAGYIDL